MGLIAPAVNAVQLREDLKAIYEAAIETDLKENGIEGVIKRELGNHEYCYTNDLDDTIEALSSYKPITTDKIKAVAKTYLDDYFKRIDAQEESE